MQAGQDPPIFGFNAARRDIVELVVERVVEQAETDPLHKLNDAAFHEVRRLERARRKKDRERYQSWQHIARSVGRMSEDERIGHVREIVSEYAWDVAGNFDPRVYQLSTKLIPGVVTALLAPRKLARLAQSPADLFSLEALSDRVQVEGPFDKLQKLAKKGTCIFVPTHLSNLDSIVFGYALERAGLPPATYGAGKNLFTNKLLSFFMHNLGAYKVDRRLRHGLYKDVLKAYSCVLIEQGYHSLFFPGGTRSRSGGIEQRLKLGLVGTALEAYARTLRAGRERRVFFVPATINYLITLEAETLVEDFLADAGKHRFIIDDDESTRLGRVSVFSRKLLNTEGSVVIRFGEPIDPFGNTVDEDGESYDTRGRRVEPKTYLQNRAGEVTIDASRDAQYTRELGEVICRAFEANTVIMATHAVAAIAFERLRRASPGLDLFNMLRNRDALTVPRDDLAADVMELKSRLLELSDSGRIALGHFMRNASGGDLIERALRAFNGYHSSPVLHSRKEGVSVSDPKLLFYYQNRLAAHGLGFNVIAPRAGLQAKLR